MEILCQIASFIGESKRKPKEARGALAATAPGEGCWGKGRRPDKAVAGRRQEYLPHTAPAVYTSSASLPPPELAVSTRARTAHRLCPVYDSGYPPITVPASPRTPHTAAARAGHSTSKRVPQSSARHPPSRPCVVPLGQSVQAECPRLASTGTGRSQPAVHAAAPRHHSAPRSQCKAPETPPETHKRAEVATQDKHTPRACWRRRCF